MAIQGTVSVTGIIAPASANDTYPVIDAKYGLDGLRNVTSIAERNAISNQKRKQGMLVGVSTSGTTTYYTLLGSPWVGDDTDWIEFASNLPLPFSAITSTPTTISGYGIIDSYPLSGNPAGFLTGYTETDPVWLADKPNYLTTASASTTYSQIGHTHSFASLTGLQTTLFGYGIIDAVTLNTPQTITGYKTFLGGVEADTSPNIELLSASGITSTGWTGSLVTGFTHTAGNTASITTNLILSAGTYYKIGYTISNRTAGTIGTTINGTVYDSNTSGNFYFSVTPTVSGLVAFTTTSTFDGTVLFSVKTVSKPTLILGGSNGTNALEFRASNQYNTLIGVGAGASSTSGTFYNVFLGFNAGLSNTTSSYNIAIGANTLRNITTSSLPNVAIGYGALQNLTSGGGANTAVGTSVLNLTTSGQYNTGLGYQPLFNNTTGSENSAFGMSASFNNTIGNKNVAFGRLSLFNNLTGSSNVAIGWEAGYNNTASNKFYVSNSRTVNLIHGDFSTGQVQINSASTPVLTPSAALEIISTTRGLLLPRMTKIQRDAIVSPVAGLVIYQTDNTAGLRTYNGTNWMKYTETID